MACNIPSMQPENHVQRVLGIDMLFGKVNAGGLDTVAARLREQSETWEGFDAVLF
jgi:hypothetical protein